MDKAAAGRSVHQHRHPEHEIEAFFYERWSPRAFKDEAIPEKTLLRMFEAARWAPSCFNEQPWRFRYALKDSPDWNTFLGLLVDANQSWAAGASALIACISKKTFTRNNKPNATHSFDAGAAWQNLALQAHLLGWAAHGMAGVHYKKAHEAFGLSDDYAVEMMIAVGRPGEPERLPENLRAREWPPSGRNKVSDFVKMGLGRNDK